MNYLSYVPGLAICYASHNMHTPVCALGAEEQIKEEEEEKNYCGLVRGRSGVLSVWPNAFSQVVVACCLVFKERKRKVCDSVWVLNKRAECERATSAFWLIEKHTGVHFNTCWHSQNPVKQRLLWRMTNTHARAYTHLYTLAGILAHSVKLMFKGVIKEHCASIVLGPNRGSDGHEIRWTSLTCVYMCVCVLCVMFKSTLLPVLLYSSETFRLLISF